MYSNVILTLEWPRIITEEKYVCMYVYVYMYVIYVYICTVYVCMEREIINLLPVQYNNNLR